jgi:multiple sugar transport system permease protein
MGTDPTTRLGVERHDERTTDRTGPAHARTPTPGAGVGMRDRLAVAVPYWFLAPTLLALVLGFGLPSIDVIRRSFLTGTIVGGNHWAGLDNFRRLFASSEFWQAVRVTLTFTVGSVVGTIILGFAAAMLMQKTFRGRGVVRSILLVPWVMPLVPATLVWQWMFDYQYGCVNYLLKVLGISVHGIDWLNQPHTALASVLIVQVWRNFPFAAVMYLSGLQTIPSEQYEAARVDGANGAKIIWYITLPGLRQVTRMLVLLVTIWSFGTSLTVVLLLTSGGPANATQTLTLLSYSDAFAQYDYGAATAIGTLVLAISAIFAAGYLRVARRRDA